MVSGLSPSEARGKLGLARDRRTVLVFGGSQGSRALNSEVVGSLAGMDLQVLHVAGKRDLEQVRSRYQAVNLSAQVREYIDPMATAYAAADLVIARAGAGTVTELGLLGIPAVLIPYPGADDHQKYNAQVLERAGAAVIIEEKSLRRDILRDKIFAQLGQGARVSDRIREKLDADFVPDAACRLADEVTGLFCP
jgi:UDP-N-acetylglucosamine--N-acetylmuramyl-(pentapeptide) pyrophosphoryl-undecaprenol N-acetylglucosamine transferase